MKFSGFWLKSTSPSQGVRTPGHYFCRYHLPCDFGQVHSPYKLDCHLPIQLQYQGTKASPTVPEWGLGDVVTDPTGAGRCRWERELTGAGVIDHPLPHSSLLPLRSWAWSS